MEIQSTTQTTLVQNVEQNKTKEISKISFTIESNSNLDPLDISFEEYKNLTTEDIKTMYANNEESKIKAFSLKSTVNFTENDTLNKIFFEDKLNDYKNGDDKSRSTLLAIALAGIPDMIKNIELSFDPDNLAVTQEQINNSPFLQELMLKKDGIRSEIPEPEINVRNSKELLEYFKNINSFFYEKIDVEGSEHFFDENIMFKDIENILDRYEKKVNDNNAILESYTKNNKPNPLD